MSFSADNGMYTTYLRQTRVLKAATPATDQSQCLTTEIISKNGKVVDEFQVVIAHLAVGGRFG